MSRAVEDLPQRLRGSVPAQLNSGFGWVQQRLRPYRPRFRDRRFWAVQGLVLLVGVTHTTLEALEARGSLQLAAVFFWPTALFFIPVVYAALNFGLAGAVATAALCTLISTPNWVLFHTGAERLGCITQVAIVDALAVFVGQRVEREMTARGLAEATGAALEASEAKYRGLFESSPVPVLILGPSGLVLDSNPAAARLFDKNAAALRGSTLCDLVGTAHAEQILGISGGPARADAHIILRSRNGAQVYLEPFATRHGDGEGAEGFQLVLTDVSYEQQRQAGLRAYATSIVHAQEEERRRIARELHDQTVQTLVLLCRQLDSGGTEVARRTAEGVIARLREFTRTLRPPTLEDLGLVTAVRRLAVELANRAAIDSNVRVVGEEQRLPAEAELGIFRIAQEALRNVERHAHAKHVTACMTFAQHELNLEVQDDGVGFTLPGNDFASSGQLGLLGMRERADALGGTLEIRSAPRSGTRVILSVPNCGVMDSGRA